MFSDILFLKSRFPCIRSYHQEPNCPYILPDDVQEGARLNVQHQFFKHIYTTNYRGPSDQALERGGLRILDVGYGSGIWLAEMSRDFPNCEYFGVDVSIGIWARTFSEEMPSVKIFQGNVMERLPFLQCEVDYVHQHNVALGITTDSWDAVISELYRVTKPGGFIDLSEVDLTPQPTLGPTSVRFYAGLLQALGARRVDTNAGRRLRSLIDSHGGFACAKDVRLCLPVGDWDGSKQLGVLWKEDVRRQLSAMREFGRAVFGGGERWWDEFVNDVVEEQAELKCFVNDYRVWAQKAF
ncbi:S-adenosyl-L-methionine-dependent methyltransferase [Cladochytrium replicatum]|nr:S-adenosyl-L-methionine-dependent methyltransferase [Cladochytrium replicatum]